MFFIVGCGRSGTTAVTKLLMLDEALTVASETLPYLAEENAMLSRGQPMDTSTRVAAFLSGNADRAARLNDPHYIEKQVTLGPFIEEIHCQSKAKFIYVFRDGRDVVSSWMTWNQLGFGSIYREAGETEKLSTRARSTAMTLLSDYDQNERSRPRAFPCSDPQSGWLSLSRFEMLCQMWVAVNDWHLRSLGMLPPEDVFFLNTTALDVASARKLFEFLDRPAPSEDALEQIIGGRVNSVQERGFEGMPYPNWENWPQNRREDFERLAGPMMERLGYWHCRSARWKPKTYGTFWKENSQHANWYKWMFDHRQSIHQKFFDFVADREAQGDKIESLIDLGCGVGHGYVQHFQDKSYLGLDMSAEAIQTATESAVADGRGNHRFAVCDYLENGIPERADIVMSSGTLDNVYDVPLCLDRMVAAADKFVYLTAYRGWFPELNAHQYDYVQDAGYFNTSISPSALHAQLTALGCTEIRIRPLWTDHDEIPFETEVWARVPSA